MLDKKINTLTSLGTVSREDLLHIVDDPSNTDKQKVTIAEIRML